jgi:hypothetical protein
MPRFVEQNRSAASINQRTEIAVQVLRNFPQEHWNALRDFYVGEQDEETVCTRHNLTLEEFREVKRRVRLRFSKLGLTASVKRKSSGAEPSGQVLIKGSV